MLLIGNALVLPLLPFPNSFHARLVQFAISRICRIFFAGCRFFGLLYCDLSALDEINRRKGLVVVPNHPAMIDAFLVLSRVNRMICIMKGRLETNLFLGAGAKLAGYVSNRYTERMLREAIAKVKAGDHLLLFPEGTRTTETPVNTFHGTAALIAKKAKVNLLPVFIYTNSPYLTKSWPIWKPPQFPVCYQVKLGEEIEASGVVAETTKQLQDLYQDQQFIDLRYTLDRQLRSK